MTFNCFAIFISRAIAAATAATSFCASVLIRRSELQPQIGLDGQSWAATDSFDKLCTRSAIYPDCYRLDIRGILQPRLFHEC